MAPGEEFLPADSTDCWIAVALSADATSAAKEAQNDTDNEAASVDSRKGGLNAGAEQHQVHFLNRSVVAFIRVLRGHGFLCPSQVLYLASYNNHVGLVFLFAQVLLFSQYSALPVYTQGVPAKVSSLTFCPGNGNGSTTSEGARRGVAMVTEGSELLFLTLGGCDSAVGAKVPVGANKIRQLAPVVGEQAANVSNLLP